MEDFDPVKHLLGQLDHYEALARAFGEDMRRAEEKRGEAARNAIAVEAALTSLGWDGKTKWRDLHKK